ncbi:kinesin-like protein KIN-14T [Quercus robur]|uniref:kinesin-like protein KIN-14T n=1 Tax=Quercus robur TaxID=38942 RepID=UPI002161B407|nr:kinesin-like protein KIN-14T [Quercus robur]XP_050277528.1 kinesin-like protein KIN-14T [Quercus robur]
MESKKSVQKLSNTIHSLLGLKARFTSTWVKSVCDIIRNLPPEGPSIELKSANLKTSDSSGNKDLDSAISKINDELAALTSNINQLNTQRRQVLDEFLDLKGNIRVFCRIRPISEGENFGHFRPVVASDSSNVLLRLTDNKSKSYRFDKVFHPGSSQDEVFSEVEPVIKSALDGYNACIFAYGQTGTGKTFTMEGNPDSPGMVPRAIEALFKQVEDSNHAFLFTFSMLEIYMGNIKDLLVPQPRKAMDPMPPCLSIQTDPKGGIEIDNLVAIQVSDFKQALRLYRLGCQSRSTASTNSNMNSSRSHSLIRISITCFDAPERRRETNKVWFVDLGGSERILKTKAWGRRLEEGKAINLSLSALGDVISALQRKRFHIPYRNSKLTQVLKDSLGKDSKTLMLVHVSPKEEDLCETICSLNFATRARSIHLGSEGSTEERQQKEVAMTNLHQKIKMIEDERRDIKRNIEKLNEKLETLTRAEPTFCQQPDAPDLSIGLAQPNLEVLSNKTRDIPKGPMSQLPRFMRPTISSKIKSGTEHPISEEKPAFRARRRRPLYHRAESVTFPVKGNSEYSSDCSISRSCVLALNMKSSVDIETEYSQETYECDIKEVVFPEQEISPRNSVNQSAHLSHSEGYGNILKNKNSSTKFLKVDNWLHSHKNETSSSSYSHRSKQVLAIPTPKKNNRPTEQKKEEKVRDEKVHNSSFEKKEIFYHEKLEKQADVERFRGSLLEEGIDKPQTLMEDCLSKELRSGSSSPLHTIGGDLMIQTQDLVHGPSIEDNSSAKHGSSSPPNMCSYSINLDQDDNGVNLMTMIQTVTGETRCPDNFLPNSFGCSHLLPSDLDYSIVDPKEDSDISFYSFELEQHCKQMTTEIGDEDNEKEDVDTSSQSLMKGKSPVLQKLRSQRALFRVHPNPKKPNILFVKSQEYAQNTGICHLLKQKIQIIYASALLGLGFQKLGFEEDFFYGLML